MRKNFYAIFLIGTLLSSANILAQPTIRGGIVSGDESSTILVPIRAYNFQSVNQFRFSLAWNDLGLSFMGVQQNTLGILFEESTSSLLADYDDTEVTLPDGTILFYAQFRIGGTPGSVWPIDLSFESLQADGAPVLNILSMDGQVTVRNLPPIIRTQYAEALGLANVVVPVTVENFASINNFNLTIAGTNGTPYVGVQDVYPGIIIDPPPAGSNTLIARYKGAGLTLPDNTVLFNIVYQVLGLPGMNRPLFLDLTSIQASGLPLPIPPQQQGIIHIIDPFPITLRAHDIEGNVGDEVIMPITVSDFQDVRLLNFILRWDPAVAEFIETDYLDSHITYTDGDGSDGLLQGTFVSNPFTSLANGTTLAELRFLMNESSGSPGFTVLIEDAKIGDVNAPYFGAQPVNGSFVKTYPTITVDSISGYHNTNVLVPIRANNFSDVNQFEFTIDWDTTGIVLEDVQDVLQGITIDIEGTTMTATLPIEDSLNVSLPDSTVLCYLNFNVTGEPGTSWPINLIISSLTEYGVAVNATGQRGGVTVNIQVPTFNPQPVEGPASSTVLVPITVQNFENIEAFELSISWPSPLVYNMVQDIYPGIVVTPVNPFTLLVSYEGGSLTLPDSTILFHIAFQLNGQPGTDSEVTVHTNAIEAWGVPLPIPLPEVGIVHVIDSDPITIIAHHVTEFVGVGQEILMPITVSNFDDVRRIFLSLTWDPLIATFHAADFLDPNINYINLITPGAIDLNFYSAPATSLADGDTLVVLRFWNNNLPGSTPLTIATSGSLVAGNGLYSGVQFVDGSITIEQPLSINITNVSGERFSNINVPVTVTSFQNVNNATFHIRWDSTQVELNDIIFEQATSWDSVHIENGLAFITFRFPNPLNLPDSTTLINLNFELIGQYRGFSNITVDHTLPREVVVNHLISEIVTFNPGSVSIDEFFISGHVRYPDNDGIYARINANDMLGIDLRTFSNNEGHYGFEFYGVGTFLSVTPNKMDRGLLNGLDMADVAAINAYVADPQTSDLTSVYQIIAADVNGDQSVTNADADLLEASVLADTLLFSNPFKFVDASYVFADIYHPYPYPSHFEIADYNALLPGTEINFVGIKPGDVNLSRDNSQGRTHAPRTVTLEVNTRLLDNGITEVEVRALDFVDVRAYQFTMSWDASEFELLEEGLFGMSRYSRAQADNGHLAIVWSSPKTEKLADGTTLVTFMLQAKDQKSTAHVAVTDAVTPTNVFDISLSKLSVKIIGQLKPGEEQGVEVYPNPALSTAQVVISSNDYQESSIEILDLSGKTIYTSVLMLQPGKNVLNLETARWIKGVYILRVRAKTLFETKKVVKN